MPFSPHEQVVVAPRFAARHAGCSWRPAMRVNDCSNRQRKDPEVVWFSPGEKHWHGASPTAAMTHIAIQEELNGKAVDWMEKVSDEQYRAGSTSPGRRAA